MNSTGISGSPRTSSIYTLDRARRAGSVERRPSASRILQGKAPAMVPSDSSRVSGRPPHSEVSTAFRPKAPPAISSRLIGRITAQTLASRPMRCRSSVL